MVRTVLIGLGGPSSSGKTTAAKSLHILFRGSSLIHLDDFFLPDDQIPYDEEKKEYNWESPNALDFVKFKEYISKIKSGVTPSKEVDTLEPDASLRLEDHQIVYFRSKIEERMAENEEVKIVFVDGFMLYHDIEIAKLFDIRLFYHASYETLKKRREARKGYNTVAGFWVDPPNYFDLMVWPAYVQSHKTLFEDFNMNKSLSNYARNDLKLKDINNEDLNIEELIDQSVTIILNEMYNS